MQPIRVPCITMRSAKFNSRSNLPLLSCQRDPQCPFQYETVVNNPTNKYDVDNPNSEHVLYLFGLHLGFKTDMFIMLLIKKISPLL